MSTDLRTTYGCGVGLRSKHYPVVTQERPKVDWFEAVSENYMDTGGRPVQILEEVRHHYPIALHGTALSIGSVDPLNQEYLERLKALTDRIDPFVVSDHICWSGVEGEVLHDLLPLPFTEEAIEHIVGRVQQVQEFLGRRIFLENVSTYVTFKHSTMPEWEFITQIAKRSGCGLLVDINNIYVNAMNHRFDPHQYIQAIPGELVGQIHLAGHTDMGDFLFDTHSATVIEKVWQLYREGLSRWGQVSTLIEWDEHIPDFETLLAQAEKARVIYDEFKGGKPLPLESVSPEKVVPSPKTSETIPLSEVEKRIRSQVHLKDGTILSFQSKTHLNPQGKALGDERMAVYANGYLARIKESLAETYEAVHQIVGEGQFVELAKAYVHEFSSSHYNLNYAGIHLPELLEEHPIKAKFPFIGDLARLERLVLKAFNAFEEKPLAPSDIANVPPEQWDQAHLIFQPSVALIQSDWPILDIWLARSDLNKIKQIDLENRPQQILVGRKGEQIRCEHLDQNQYKLLEGLLKGRTLGAACEELAETSEDESLPINVWFATWIQEGLIRRCDFSKKAAA